MATKGQVDLTVSAAVSVACDDCGESLYVSANESTINVGPCKTCMQATKDDAYNDGYDKGLDAGRAEGGE